MTRKIVLLGAATAALFTLPAAAADYETKIALPAGSVINVTVQRSREMIYREINLGKDIDIAARYRATVTPQGDGYRVKVEFVGMGTGNPALDAQSRENVAAEQQLSTLFKGIEFSASGALLPSAVINWSDHIRASTNEMAVKANIPADSNAMQAVRDLYGSMSPESAATLILREWRLAPLAQNRVLTLNQPVQASTVSPTAIGVDITSVRTTELASVAAGTAVITERYAYDPATAKALTEALVEALIEDPPEFAPQPDALVLAKFTAEDTTECRYEMDVASGLAKRSDCTLSTMFLSPEGIPQRMVERLIITQELARP